MHTVIVRDDDTNALTPVECLERLYRPFLDRGLNVNLAVIPEVRTDVRRPDGSREGYLPPGRSRVRPRWLSLAANAELVGYLRANPGYRVAQHGCHHDYLEFDTADRREIAHRLDRGAECLEAAGFPRPRTFVAPYDRVSRTSLAEVAGRFDVFSAGWFELGRVPVAWWPCYFLKKAMRRQHWRAGRTLLLTHPGCLLSRHRPIAGMLDSVRRAVERQRLTVLVTHWWEYFPGGEPDAAMIDVLHKTADLLAGNPGYRVVGFEDLVRR